MIPAIAERRLRRQLLTAAPMRTPEDVVAWFGAVQAQEYEHAKWALGLRMPDSASVADVDRAVEDGRVLRTHVMRPTWHFVARRDIRWLLELTAPNVHRRMAPYNAQLGLDGKTLTRTLRIIERAVGDGRFLTRAEIGDALGRAGLPMKTVHLAHVAMHAELECVVCSGPRSGKQFTYALFAERAPDAQRVSRDEALDTLARRFFRSHGPATIRDFAWWSGLSAGDARRAVDVAKARAEDRDGRKYWTCDREPRASARNHVAYLLPIYDEYIVAYRDRDAVPHGRQPAAPGPRFTTFAHTLVIGGQVAGAWQIVRKSGSAHVEVTPSRRLTRPERAAVDEAVHRYTRFVTTRARSTSE